MKSDILQSCMEKVPEFRAGAGTVKTDDFPVPHLNNRRKCCIFIDVSIVSNYVRVRMMLEFFENYAGLFIYPMLAIFLSLIFTYLCIRILPRLGYVDKPGGRHIHKNPVPRGGGIAVIFAFFITLALYGFGGKSSQAVLPLFWRLFWPAVVLCGLGLIDDRREMKSWQKLLGQFFVVLIIWYTGDQKYSIFGWEISGYLSLLFQFIWVIVIINAFNLIDGLDGLASGLAIVSSGCMAIWFILVGGPNAEAVCMLILAGACLGFLRYNFYPARIFLGDTGSTFLGLIFAIIGLSTIDKVVTVTSLLLPILAVGVPLFDVVLAIWRRSTRKLLNPEAGGIMDGDQDHLHHRLLRQTKKQTTTAFMMYLMACVFAGIALLFLTLRDSMPAVAYVTLVIAILIMIRQLAIVEIYDSALLIQKGLAKPKQGILVNMIHPFIDFFLIGLSFLITFIILIGQFQHFSFFLYAFVPPVLVLCFSRVYRIYWLRAGLNNYWHLALSILIGSAISCTLLYYFCYDAMLAVEHISLRRFIGGCLLFTLLNLTLICFERFLVHYGEGFLFRKLYLQYQEPSMLQRIVIYGGGLNCRVYISYLFCANRRAFSESVIGIMDDDPGLYGLKVYGFKVFGGVDQVEQIYEDHPFEKIVIATDSASDENLEHLRSFCDDRKIQLVKLTIAETAFDDYLATRPPNPENEAENGAEKAAVHCRERK